MRNPREDPLLRKYIYQHTSILSLLYIIPPFNLCISLSVLNRRLYRPLLLFFLLSRPLLYILDKESQRDDKAHWCVPTATTCSLVIMIMIRRVSFLF